MNQVLEGRRMKRTQWLVTAFLTAERKGGWGKAFWWARMSVWIYRCAPRLKPQYTLAA